LGTTAVVRGDISTLGGYLDKDPEALVEGQVNSGFDSNFHIQFPGRVYVPAIGVGAFFSPIWNALSLLFATFVMAALAIVAVMFWPKHTERAAHAVISQPVLSGGMGLLTVAVLPFATVAMAITLILIPVIPLGLILLVVMVIFGWIALGLELGQRFAQALKQDWHPALAAGMGTFALTFVALGVNQMLDCVGWIVPFTVTLLGLGAVLLTRFGTRDYPGVAAVPAAPVPVPPVVPPTVSDVPPAGDVTPPDETSTEN
jgi:hypothetical protein